MAKTETIKTLTPVEHILARPSMYISSTKVVKNKEWIVAKDGKIEYKEIPYVPALAKIINEAIDNSVDEGLKTDWIFSNKISVTIKYDEVNVTDNGRGIPTDIDPESKERQCVNAVCVPMSGSNFDDDNNTHVGLNGLGIKSANIFSSRFECVTCDGKAKIKIVCKNNLSSKHVTELDKTDKRGTSISFKPDFSRFECDEIGESIKDLIETRLKFLSLIYPKCSFIFNGEKVNIKAKDMSQLFPQPSVVLSEDNAYILVYPADEQNTLTFVNSLYMSRGGTHVDYIMNKLSGDIREKVSKKFKNIKPADIKNRLGIVVFLSGFPNCSYDSQSKERLTNAQGEISKYLADNKVDLDKLSAKVCKEKTILDNITELFRLKEELAERKAVDKLNSKSKKDYECDKYFPPLAKTPKKYLMVVEGESAFAGLAPLISRNGFGWYKLMGKILNCNGVSDKKLLDNKVTMDLINILGIDLRGNTDTLSYERVVCTTDADCDGLVITGLIINMFKRIAPEVLKKNIICRLETPMIVGMKGNKVVECFYKFPDASELKSDIHYKYIKGLGTLDKNVFPQVVEMAGGIENMLREYRYDEDIDASIQKWFSDDSEPRKIALRGREFHIDKA